MTSDVFKLSSMAASAALGIADRLGLEVLEEKKEGGLVSLELSGDPVLLNSFRMELSLQGVT